jgi:RNA polymerase sigma factor (sigma-70 family)
MEIAPLIKDAAKGNAAAQKCLFDRFADPMMTVCCRYLKSREDAEERLLDGFIKFFRHLPEFSYQGEAALYSWLKTIMVRECLMFLRKKNIFSMIAEVEAEEISMESEALAALSAREIFDLIVQLPLGYRTVFNLHVMEGLDHKQIAGELGIAEGTSKSQLSKARALLQKMLLQKGISYGQRKTQ